MVYMGHCGYFLYCPTLKTQTDIQRDTIDYSMSRTNQTACIDCWTFILTICWLDSLQIPDLVEDEDADEVDGGAGGGDEERGVSLEHQRTNDVCLIFFYF